MYVELKKYTKRKSAPEICANPRNLWQKTVFWGLLFIFKLKI